MEQIIRMIQERTGIDAAKARTAADTVVEFLQDKLPEPVAGQIRNVLDGGDSGASPMDRIQGMFGRER